MGLITRRGLIGSGAAAAASTLVLPRAAGADAQQCGTLEPALATAPPGGRIDLHAHHIPPVYREALLAAGKVAEGGYPPPVWTPERATTFMDTYGIQLQVVSISDPGVGFTTQDKATPLARQINEYTAEVIKDHPTRFGGYAVLPLPDVNAALAEVAYALDVLKLDGIGLLTSYAGNNIAMPQFEPLWDELARRNAVVYIHPCSLAADDKPSYVLPDFVVEFTFETTRFCALALNSGLTTKYPDLPIQLAHAGGAFPFLSYRVAILETGAPSQVAPDPASRNGVLPAEQLRNFYFDTGLASSPAQMRSVLEISDINHIVFGTDWPYTEALFVVPGDPEPLLSKTFDERQRHAVERANALALLPSVAKRLGAPAADRGVDAKLVRARIAHTRKHRRELRLLVDAREPVQVDVTLERGKHKIAATRFAPVARGRRTLRLTLPADAPSGTAQLTAKITDAFGNRTTVHRKVAA